MSEKLIARCGINCSECEAYIATINDDNDARAEVAKKWCGEYNPNIKPEDINCFGCTSTGKPVFSWCNMCKVRACGTEKDVETCAHCDGYICETLQEMFDHAPTLKEGLDKLRSEL
jgi:hypothetical protein